MKRMVSGIKPTGELTLGNYIGAIKNFIEFQNEYEMFIFIADLHALTKPQDRLKLRKRIKDITALYIACGLDPDKVTIFIQSEIPAHSQLAYLLECHSYIGELGRMTQYKDQISKQAGESITASLFTYPVLMAADIILYDADFVPVGDDQKQHIELTRNIAQRFNSRHGDFFKVPEPVIPKQGARIMDLQDPLNKMSKSDDSDKGYILLLDDLNRIKNKIKGAVTDSFSDVRFDLEKKPGISNLMTIYSTLTKKSIKEIEDKYRGKGYGEFKSDLADIVVATIKPIQEKYNNIIKSTKIDEILDVGRDKISKIAYKKIMKANNKLGLGRKR
ncbi:tryptophan--tRNA ligase [Mycoplasmatota bacterium]|nr:tryptophan--tRNA ligase [Mycoplasmatota bacterium]